MYTVVAVTGKVGIHCSCRSVYIANQKGRLRDFFRNVAFFSLHADLFQVCAFLYYCFFRLGATDPRAKYQELEERTNERVVTPRS